MAPVNQEKQKRKKKHKKPKFRRTISKPKHSQKATVIKQDGPKLRAWLEPTVPADTAESNEFAKLVLESVIKEPEVEQEVKEVEQGYVQCRLDKRFLVLYTFLNTHRDKKIIVAFNNYKVSAFYEEILSQLGIKVIHAYRVLGRTLQTEIFNQFSKLTCGVLLCSDTIANQWDIPDLDWILQYDLPFNFNEYVDRVVNLSLSESRVRSILFITEEEFSLILHLKSVNINSKSMDIMPASVKFQTEIERLVDNQYVLFHLAKRAFTTAIRGYDSHPLRNLLCFPDLEPFKLAKSFCLAALPVNPGVALARRGNTTKDFRKKSKKERKQKRSNR